MNLKMEQKWVAFTGQDLMQAFHCAPVAALQVLRTPTFYPHPCRGRTGR